MKPVSRRERVAQALRRVDTANAVLQDDARPLMLKLRAHRTAWILGGGFAAGIASALLPRGWWARLGSFSGSSTALLMRSFIAPILAEATAFDREKQGAAAQNESEEI